jgi:glycosyltransferase involved in cell wall biosynthesis
MNKPLISIITVCYNSVKTIEETIQSVLAQDYPAIEYIIVDGGSKDGTLDVIYQYKHKISQIISEPDNGIYDAMNKGIHLAKGNVVGLLNADDIYANNKVISAIMQVMSDPNSEACYGDLI